MKTETHHPKLLGRMRSICCNADTNIFPASLGDPAFRFCTSCNKECEAVWMPSYQEVSRGTWRKIDYSVQVV